jgi:hypothetical protein
MLFENGQTIVLIGDSITDCGRPDEAVPDHEYEATLRHLARRAIDETGCRLIIAEPYVIETDPDDPQLRDTRVIDFEL